MLKKSISASLLFFSLSSLASTHEAWQTLFDQIKTACTEASSLKAVKPVGQLILFDDSVTYKALLLEGQYSQQHMENQIGRELCLYQSKTKTAHVAPLE